MATKNIVFGEPQANTTSLETAQCDYRQVNAGNGILAAISINVHPYNPSATYGFAADGQSWTAPSAAEGASNVCALASAVKTVGGLTGICSQVGATQYVIGANRLNALIFPAGDYFYSVRVMNIYESDSLTAPLTQISSLLADRKPVGR